MSVGKACLTEEIITDWRQKKKNGEGERPQIREEERERGRKGREEREEADKH